MSVQPKEGSGSPPVYGHIKTPKATERAHFFSSTEQELLIEGYEAEKEILTGKSNTTRAAKLREEAWQRIAEKLNAASGSGNNRTWQQVKIKYKNILQTANKKRFAVKKPPVGAGSPVSTSAEELVLQHNNAPTPKDEGIPGGTCSEPEAGSSSAYIGVTVHSLTLLPPPKSEPDHCDESLSTDTRLDEDLDPSSSQERLNTNGVATGETSGEKSGKDIKSLYRRYLKKEMENRDQEMAYRALKMRKMEKELLLLDRQLDKA